MDERGLEVIPELPASGAPSAPSVNSALADVACRCGAEDADTLYEVMGDFAAAVRERDAAIRDLCAWRSAIQAMTPGGSEFMHPQAVRNWADMQKRENSEAKLEVARLRRQLRLLSDGTNGTTIGDSGRKNQ